MRSISPARASFGASSIKPGANSRISNGAASTPATVTINNVPISVPLTRLTSSRTSSKLRWERYSDNTGTNAWENAPSANRRRRKLGILKATKNASALAVEPK